MNSLILIVSEGWIERLMNVLAVLGLLVLAGMNIVAGMAIGFENILGTPREAKIICYAFVFGEAALIAVAYIIFGGG
jgi:hypothetical protein